MSKITLSSTLLGGSKRINSDANVSNVSYPKPAWVDDVLERAQEYAEDAEQAAEEIKDLTVSSVTLPAGESATVTKTESGGVFNLEFGLPRGETGLTGPKGDKGDTGAKGDTGDPGPKGDKGDTGSQGPKGDKGDTGSQGPKGDQGDVGLTPDFSIGTVTTLPSGESATASITGTPENPELNLGIPSSSYISTEVSGSIIAVSDATPMPVRDLTVSIEPVQSGSGTPSPSNVRPISGWDAVKVTRTGKNILDDEFESGSIVITSGYPTPDPSWMRSKNYVSVCPNTKYYVKADSGIFAKFFDKNLNVISTKWDLLDYKNAEFTTDSNAYYMKVVFPVAMDVSSFCINYPSTATEYTPYVGNEYEIDLDGTVYGGTLDVTTGVLTATHSVTTMTSGLEWNTYEQNGTKIQRCVMADLKGVGHAKEYFSSHFSQSSDIWAQIEAGQIRNYYFNVYNLEFCLAPSTTREEWKAFLDEQVANGTPVQVYHYLATPITIQLTPQEITMLAGNNTLWADSGDSTLRYFVPIAKEITDTYDSTSHDGMSGVAVASAISGKANTADLASVATSGSYNDLSNKPTIPTAVSQLTNDSNFTTKPVLLWSNETPTASFGAQQVSTPNLSDYSMLLYQFQYTTGASASIMSDVTPVENPARLCAFHIGNISGGNASAYMTTRIATPNISSNIVDFASATRCTITSGATATNNEYCIPIRIYGIK